MKLPGMHMLAAVVATVASTVVAAPQSEAIPSAQTPSLLDTIAATAAKAQGRPAHHDATRSFSVDLDNDGTMDAVYHHRESNQIWICFDGDITKCQSERVDNAVDVLPVKTATTSGLMLIDPRGATMLCQGYALGFRAACSPVQAAALASQTVDLGAGLLSAKFTSDLGSIGCTLSQGLVQHCTSSRPLQAGVQSLLGGFSSPARVELMRIEGATATICDVRTGDCTPQAGIAMPRGALRLGAIRSFHDESFSLVAAGDSAVAVCAVSNGANGGLQCANEEIGPQLATLRPFAMAVIERGKSLERVDFLPALPVALKRVQAAPVADDELARTQMEAQLAVRRLVASMELDSRGVATKLLENNSSVDMAMGASQLLVVGDGWLTFENMSDEFGYYFHDFTSWSWERSPAACAACDTDRAADDGYCAMIGTTVFGLGLGITVIVTAAGSVTGPGAVAIFVNGISVSGSFAAGAYMSCVSMAATRHAQCRAASC